MYERINHNFFSLSIYVYRARNAITQRKSKVKLEVDGAVTAIL